MMWVHFCWICIFIDFIFKGKTLANFTNLFSPGNFENNYKVY